MRNLFLRFLMLVLAVFLAGCLSSDDSGGSGSGADTTAPTVTTFALPATSSSLTVSISSLVATDNVGVTAYLITTSATPPSISTSGWSNPAPSAYTFAASGTQTAYAWARDAAGNVSAARMATVNITLASIAARTVQGVVNDLLTGQAISGATVTAYRQTEDLVRAAATGVPVASTTSAVDGSYRFDNLIANEAYFLEVVKSGYATLTYYNIIGDANNVLQLERASSVPSSLASYSGPAGGKVRNASTNAGLPGMTVKLRAGINHRAGSLVGTATTNSSGDYSFSNLPAGAYTAEVSGNIGSTPIITAYFTLISVSGGASVTSGQDFPVTVPLTSSGSGQYRIVLSWGSNPSDLDSHLVGPASSGKFWVNYAADDYPAGTTTTSASGFRVAGTGTEAFLDVDNTIHGYDNGPETTTIVVPRTGAYRFLVHHFSGSSNISASGAQVKVYKGDALLATFNPPNTAVGDEDVWDVFSMTVTSSGETITTNNSITVAGGSSYIQSLSH